MIIPSMLVIVQTSESVRCCLPRSVVCLVLFSLKNVASLPCPISVLHFVFFSFYDKKKFSSKKEQKTIDASEKVSTSSLVFLVHLILTTQFLLQNVRA